MSEISVVIPVYNVDKYLATCLDSIQAQTFSDIDIICINDGSTDDSGEILHRYATKDHRIKIINQANAGLSAARNIGIMASESKYIAFIDSDDYILPDFLERLYKTAEQNQSDICGCNFFKLHHNTLTAKNNSAAEQIYTPALPILLDKRNFVHFSVWNKLYRRELIQNIKFINGIYFEDWVFNSCVFAKAKNFTWINEKLYVYRIRNDSIMRSKFSEKKLNDYVIGINKVHEYYMQNCPQYWHLLKKSRIARTVKMLMNSIYRSKDKNLYKKAKMKFKDLYLKELIGYKGLSLINKIKLFRLLH